MSSNDAPKKDKQSLHYILRSGIAGGVAGCVAKTVVAPLDRVKILFQASNPDFHQYAGTWSGAFRAVAQIHRENGFFGLFQGHSATLLRIFPYAAIKFMAYDQIEHLLMPTPESQTNKRRFAAGALSGMTSVFFTYPLDVIRVRMAFHTRSTVDPSRPTFLHAMSKIYHETSKQPLSTTTATSSPSSSSAPRHSSLSETSRILFTRFPILKFYRGFTVTIIGMVPYAGTSFLTWGYLHSILKPKPTQPGSTKPPPTPIADLTIGALSGAISQTVSYPFEVIRRRMQVGGITNPDRWLGWNETVRSIWRTGGWQGFYIGLSIGYMKMIPMTAVSFTVWQYMKRVLDV
ncbi:mitochondrial carrier domain-containing protein [Abortiporus biennis]|nr:mitochondrial carrier domain-containing protein [Abortiporus biennis]